MADSFRLGLDADRLVLWSDSTDRATVDEFRAGGDHLREIDVVDRAGQSLYPRDYLETLTTLQHSVEAVELQTGQDYPLKVVAVDDRFDLSFTVAPRIDEDGATGDQLRSIPTVAAGQQTETQVEPDAYAIVDESYENPVGTWFRNDAAEHRFNEQAARDRAAELEEKVPIGIYQLTAQRIAEHSG